MGEEKKMRLIEEMFRAERPVSNQTVKNQSLRSEQSSQFNPSSSYFLIFSLSNERSYYCKKKRLRKEKTENQAVKINIEELERKGRSRNRGQAANS